jgi:starch phosphorylase
MFYARPNAYAEVMRSAIAINGSFFNTQRMMAQYVLNAYFPDEAKASVYTADNLLQIGKVKPRSA